jgi:hypothetical protein
MAMLPLTFNLFNLLFFIHEIGLYVCHIILILHYDNLPLFVL